MELFFFKIFIFLCFFVLTTDNAHKPDPKKTIIIYFAISEYNDNYPYLKFSDLKNVIVTNSQFAEEFKKLNPNLNVLF